MPNMSYCRFENTYRDLVDCETAVSAVESQWSSDSDEVAAELGISSFQLKEDKVYSLGQSIAQNIHDLPPVIQDMLMDRFLDKVPNE